MSGQYLATPENDLYAGEKGLHISGTRDRGRALDFWMFNPPVAGNAYRIRGGICKRPMDGYRRCPYCYPEKEVL